MFKSFVAKAIKPVKHQSWILNLYELSYLAICVAQWWVPVYIILCIRNCLSDRFALNWRFLSNHLCMYIYRYSYFIKVAVNQITHTFNLKFCPSNFSESQALSKSILPYSASFSLIYCQNIYYIDLDTSGMWLHHCIIFVNCYTITIMWIKIELWLQLQQLNLPLTWFKNQYKH